MSPSVTGQNNSTSQSPSAVSASTSVVAQNNSTSQSSSAASSSPSADSTDNISADSSKANTESTEASESTDYLTTDITLSDDTRIVIKKDTNVVDLEEGKQYINVSSVGDKVQEIFTHGNGDEYYEAYIEIVKVLL